MLKDIVNYKKGTSLIDKNGDEISYVEVDKLSSSLARCLYKTGIDKNSILPVFVDNSVETIIFAIACWKADAIFTPINPDLPTDTLDLIFRNLNCDYVFFSNSRKNKFSIEKFKNHVEELKDENNLRYAYKDRLQAKCINSTKQLSVIIHT